MYLKKGSRGFMFVLYVLSLFILLFISFPPHKTYISEFPHISFMQATITPATMNTKLNTLFISQSVSCRRCRLTPLPFRLRLHHAVPAVPAPGVVPGAAGLHLPRGVPGVCSLRWHCLWMASASARAQSGGTL